MELDALTSSVLELARRLDIATPTLGTLASLLRLQGKVLELYQRRPEIEAAIAPTSGTGA